MTRKGLLPGICYTPECAEVSRWIPIADPPHIPGDPHSRYRCAGCCDALSALVNATLPEGYSRLPLNAPERAAFTVNVVRVLGLAKGALMAELAATDTTCWNDLCVLSACDGEHHGDNTGHSWRQRRGESYCPVHQMSDACHTYRDAANAFYATGDTWLPVRPHYCPECGDDVPAEEDVAGHHVYADNGVLLVGCEGYHVHNPATFGLPAEQWTDWRADV